MISAIIGEGIYTTIVMPIVIAIHVIPILIHIHEWLMQHTVGRVA